MKIRTDFITNSSSASFVAFVVSKDSVLSDEAYAKIFEKELENTKKWVERSPTSEWAIRTLVTMESITDENEKIEYARDNIDIRDTVGGDNIEVGGMESDYIGITIGTILKEYPDVKVGDLKQFVANKLNEFFNTNLEAKDVDYVEEAWMDN